MSVVLSEHLPLLASAPDGIQKLRGLILELAVRGKLVLQDPNDEPVSELLKRIAKERARLEAEGVCRKAKAVPPVSEDERPFGLPYGWEWIRLGALGLVGSSSRVHQKDWTDQGVPFYRAREVVKLSREGFVKNELYISEARYESLAASGLVPSESDLVVTGVGTIGVPYIVKAADKFYFKDASVLIFKNHHRLCAEYIRIFMTSPYWVDKIHEQSMGTTVHTLTIVRANEVAVPLPPLAEQGRIVAKVDELMALCDRLEAEQADAESAHARLVETLLGTLTQSTDAAELAANWQRLAEHFDTLFTTESALDALKQTILQLAVMGKLVPQEPTKVGRTTSSDGIVLPTGWRLEQINQFCNVQGGIQKTPTRRPVKNHFPYLRVANVQRGAINVDELARYELTQEELARWSLNAGDLLVVEGNGSESEIGRCAIWNGQVADCVYQNHLIRVRPHVSEQVDYLQLFLNSPVGVCHMKRLAITTSGLFNLSVGKIRGIEVPLPPLHEQHRIVAKVDELMALCDRVKADLADSRSQQARLSATLIESALQAA